MSERVPTRFKLTDVKLTRHGPEVTLHFTSADSAKIGVDIVIGIDDAVEVYPATVSILRQ